MSNKKSRKQDSTVTVAIIGAVATIAVALIGVATVVIQRQPVATSAAPTTIPETKISTTAAPTVDAGAIFSDTFNNNHAVWSTGVVATDYFTATRDVKDGEYYH